MTEKCEHGNRCSRCLKLQYKLQAKRYQEMRAALMTNSPSDPVGNIFVHPFKIQAVLNQRVRVGRAYRRWKRRGKKP
jgi:hypothetical protein